MSNASEPPNQPPPAPPLPTTLPSVEFKDANGNPLRIWVLPDVPRRKTLVNQLRKKGANLCQDIHSAQLILLPNDEVGGEQNHERAEQRQEDITSWDNPPSRCVLDVEWAWTALRQNRVPLEADNWAGFRLGTDTGSTQNPFPTPRQTPVETTEDDFQPSKAALAPSNHAGTPLVDVHSEHMSKASAADSQIPFQGSFPDPDGQFRQVYQYMTQNPGYVSAISDLIRQTFTQGLPHTGIMQSPQTQPTHFPLTNGHKAESPEEARIPPSLRRNSRHETLGNSSKTVQKRPHFDSDEDNEHEKPRRSSKQHKRWSGAIFQNKRGESLNIYLQVGLPSRKEYSDTIKKHGGRIAINVDEADFAILYPWGTAQYQSLLPSCEQHGVPALNKDFLDACVNESEFLDPEDYLVTDTVVIVEHVGGRGRPSKPTVMKREVAARREAAREERSPTPENPSPATRLKAKQAAGPRKASTVKAERTKSSPSSSKKGKFAEMLTTRAVMALSKLDRRAISRSPSPTPPGEAVEYVQGRNLYTEQEIAYMLKYMPKLLTRDPDATINALSKKLHEKMPQHPVGSWINQVTNHRKEVDKIRKKCQIKMRKTQTAFEDIVTWFQEGNADALDDESVWPALAAEHAYMSDKDWERYWGDNARTINAEVEARRSQGGTSVGT